MFKIIKSSSKGNAYLFDDTILIDCGIAFKHLESYVDKIKLVLLTHEHSDHINVPTLKKLVNEYEKKVVAPIFLKNKLKDINNINFVTTDTVINTKKYTISMYELVHDVQNVGYFITNKFTSKNHLHITDTFNTPSIDKRIHSLSIETNYCEFKIDELIEDDVNNDRYSHYIKSRKNHLSVQKALNFIDEKNIKLFWTLHKSVKMEEDIDKMIEEFKNEREIF